MIEIIIITLISLFSLVIFIKFLYSNYNRNYEIVLKLTNKALNHEANEDYEEALKILLTAKKIMPSYPYIYYDIGNCYYYLNQYKEAKEYFIKSIEIENGLLNAYIILAKILIKFEKDLKLAEYYLNQVIEIEYDYAEAYNLLAILYNEQDRIEEGINIFKKAIHYDKNNYILYNNLGVLEIRNSNYSEAEKHFNTALNIKNNYIDALCNLGNLFSIRLQYNQALEYFQKALYIDNNNDKIYYWLGAINYKIDNIEAAKKHLLKATEINNKNADAYYLLGLIYNKTGEDILEKNCVELIQKLKPELLK